MADNSYKNIQDILVGEKVSAFDIANMKPASAKVTTTFKRPDDNYFEIGKGKKIPPGLNIPQDLIPK